MKIFPDPGIIPTKATPKRGESIEITVTGLPPYKGRSVSIRNPKHKYYDRFIRLRNAAIIEMDGRKWSDESIELNVEVFAPKLDSGLSIRDYVSGIFDTLDGSHGQYFTYLPIVYQDDCQISSGTHRYNISEETYYTIKVIFIGGNEFKKTNSITFTT